jgi:hypothetical protein
MSMPDSRAQKQGASGTVIDTGDIADGDGNARSTIAHPDDSPRRFLADVAAAVDSWRGEIAGRRCVVRTWVEQATGNIRGEIEAAGGYVIAWHASPGGNECSTPTEDLDLHRVTLMLCTACLIGAGGECYTPGCALWMSARPDTQVDPDADGRPIEIPASSMAKLVALVDEPLAAALRAGDTTGGAA